MKKLYTTLLIIFCFTFCKAQYVTIPDSNFVKWLQVNGFDSCMNGNQLDTTCNKVLDATSIDCSENYYQVWNIKDLTGIQYFKNLDTLNCAFNEIINMAILPPNLQYFNCAENSLSSLLTLPSNTAYLDCSGNLITSLANLPASLTYLNCQDNKLANLPPLPSSLTYLDCSDGQLLTYLPDLPSSLAYLDCSYDQLVLLPDLPSSLIYLDCSDNKFTAWGRVGVLPALPSSLQVFICENNLIAKMPAIPLSLNYLDFGWNAINSLPALPQIMNTLILTNNGLTCLPPITELTGTSNSFEICNNFSDRNGNYPFDISGNDITCLPNHIAHPNMTSIPAIDNLPVCGIITPNGCEVKWNISGKTYLDTINNCDTAISEPTLQNIKVLLFDSTGNNLLQQIYTDDNGKYSFSVGFGRYIEKVDTANTPLKVLCPFNNLDSSKITIANVTDYGADFRLLCKHSGFDLDANSVNYVQGSFFPGHSALFDIQAGDISNRYNLPCKAFGISGIVKAIFSGPVTYKANNGAIIPNAINGDTISWNITDFSLINFYNSFSFWLNIDSSARSGDEVCFTITIAPDSGKDNNPANNTLIQCLTVHYSMDPNYKEVYPSTANPNDWLTYTIHFQNTGTAAAQNIQVLDTLDSNLDPGTFQLLAYSVTPYVQIKGSIVAFDFPNIELPDSTGNQDGSKGFVQYRVKPLATIPSGATVQNSASIYFDFNSPVRTNTVENKYCAASIPTSIAAFTCEGLPYTYYDSVYTTNGTHSYTLQNSSGCDSMVNLTLTIYPTYIDTLNKTLCYGDSYFFNGTSYNTTGNFSATFPSVNGCDSIINLNLTVLDSIPATVITSGLCSGKTFVYDGTTYSTPGTFPIHFAAANGCDSLVELELAIIDPLSPTQLYTTICAGESFSYNSNTYDTTGVYSATYTAANGCDSTVNLNLTVQSINSSLKQSNDTLTATGNGTVQWMDCNSRAIINNETGTVFIPTTSGSYAAIITNGPCSDTTNCATVISTNSNQLPVNSNQLVIYPNPTSGMVSIVFSHPCNNCTVNVTDVLGRPLIVDAKVLSPGEDLGEAMRLNLSNLSAGLYFIHINTATETQTAKVVKK